MIKIAIIGSHGLYASYGGWDQLVNNLVEKASKDVSYIVFNPKETPVDKANLPSNVKVIRLPLSAAGYPGLAFDFISILIAVLYCRNLLLLGIQGMPIASLVRALSFNRIKIAANIGGIEWDRPQFSSPVRWYLKLCFFLASNFATRIIIDNEHYLQYFDEKRHLKKLQIIAYGGFIDKTIDRFDVGMEEKYPFINSEYFLSVSRSIEDNKLKEICDYFKSRSELNLVLISNFSNSIYGKEVLGNYSSNSNIYLIDGLYIKPELDCIRRNCKAYIHTHTLCGSAPSLIEMIVARRPVFSIDVPQNRYTLNGYGFIFTKFQELDSIIYQDHLEQYNFPESYSRSFEWRSIVLKYEACFYDG